MTKMFKEKNKKKNYVTYKTIAKLINTLYKL